MTTNHVMMDAVNVTSYVDPERSSTPVAASNLTSPASYASMAALDTAIIAGSSLTQADLNKMTLNDKVYQLRVLNGDVG